MSKHKKRQKTSKKKKRSRAPSRSSSNRGACDPESSDLSPPSRPFPKATRIEPGTSRFPQIRVRKTRWEPLSQEKINELKKHERKTDKSKKELVRDFHKEKDHFLPLDNFVDNRKRLAVEVLETLDLRTRNEIFPELEEKSDSQAQKLVHNVLKGMSRKRVIAALKGSDISDSSSTSDMEEGSGNRRELETQKHSSKRATRKREPKNKRKVRSKRKDEDLEEGEIPSSGDDNEQEDAIPTVSSSPSQTGQGKEELEDKKAADGQNESKPRGTVRSHSPGFLDELLRRELKKEEQEQRRRIEPKFIISFDCSTPTVGSPVQNGEDDGVSETEQFEQKVICILPPSPSALENEDVDAETNAEMGTIEVTAYSPVLQQVAEVVVVANTKEDGELDENGEGELEQNGGNFSTEADEGKSTTSPLSIDDEELEEPDIELVV